MHERLEELYTVPCVRYGIDGFAALSNRERKEILERDDYTSQMRAYDEQQGWILHPGLCGEGQKIGCRELHVHHIVPQHMGGKDTPDNLISVFSCLHVGKCKFGRIKNG